MTIWFAKYDNIRVTSSAVETTHRTHSIKNMGDMAFMTIPNIHTLEEKDMTLSKFGETDVVTIHIMSSYYEEQYGIDLIIPPEEQ